MKNLTVKMSRRALLTVLLSMCFGFSAFAQNVQVTGTVLDATGETIIGAYVTLVGDEAVGTITDFDGYYELSVPSNAKLDFSYTGYESKVVAVAGKSVVDVTLHEATNQLEEVVAVGYGSQKAKEITSSVASVKSENFNAGVKESPMGLLQGKVAGLNISRTGGDPTSTSYNIQIRGFSTLDKGAGSTPLYIVDGIPVNNIDNISPDDIASMDVLKDGSAAAIYGTRGTNGVIIITTKRGGNETAECGVANVEYSTYFSTQVKTYNDYMATAEQFRNLRELSNGKLKPSLYTNPSTGETYNTDWMSELTRDAAFTHNHNLAISGATKNFSYRGSISFKNAQGITKESNRQEVIAKLAANQKALQGWLDLQYDFSYMHYRNDFFTGDLKQAGTLNPTYPVYDKNTTSGYFKPIADGTSNPVASMNQIEEYQDGNYFRGSVKASLNILPVPGLKANAFVAIEEGDNYKYKYFDQNYALDGAQAGQAYRNVDRNFNTLVEATLDYSGQWNGHTLALVAGYSYQNFWSDGNWMGNGGFVTNDSKYYSMGDGAADKSLMSIGSYTNSNTLMSGFLRANYNYAEKYLLSASVRYEGSSRFGDNNKWGWFPAASAGWRISGEDFLKNSEHVDDLKLRFGFGVTGNNLASDLRSKALLGPGGTFWYNGEWVTTYKSLRDPNPYLQWEKKFEYNIGIDFAFLNNRLYGNIDLYMRNTNDLLWDYDVTVGAARPDGGVFTTNKFLANAGVINSKGIELALTGVPVKTENWNWTTTATLAFNDNKILQLSDSTLGFNYTEMLSGSVSESGLMKVNTQLIREGMSVGTFYGLKVDHSKGENGINNKGELQYEDIDGDGNITDADKQIIGQAQPLFTFGWNNVIRYKWFDLTLFFRGVVGNDVLNVTRWAYLPSKDVSKNVMISEVDKIANGTGVMKGGKNQEFSDYWLEDGSYLKLDNITLGCNVPLPQNKYVSGLRVYFTAQNVFTISSYSGKNPEVNTSDVWGPGIDYTNFYPNTTSFMIGANVKF